MLKLSVCSGQLEALHDNVARYFGSDLAVTHRVLMSLLGRKNRALLQIELAHIPKLLKLLIKFSHLCLIVTVGKPRLLASRTSAILGGIFLSLAEQAALPLVLTLS